jgi:hypothetical protein
MYINLNAAAIPARIVAGTKIHLNGSALTTVTVEGGTVALGMDPGDEPTLTTMSLQTSGTVYVGPGCVLTTYKQAAGTGHLYVAATTVEAQGGTFTTYGTGAITTFTNWGANVFPNSTGTITTFNARAGTSDFSRSRLARTVTTLNHYKPASVVYDTSIVTVTTYAPSGLLSLSGN